MTGCGCLFCGCGFSALGQTCQQCLIGNEAFDSIAVGLGYHVIAELEREESQLFVDLFETLFLVFRQVSAVVRKRLIGLGHKAHLLGIETQLVTLVIDELHALEELVVEDDSIAQVAQHRTYLLCDLVHLIVAVSLQHIEEHTLHAV